MSNVELMTKHEATKRHARSITSSSGILASFVIRHLNFVISRYLGCLAKLPETTQISKWKYDSSRIGLFKSPSAGASRYLQTDVQSRLFRDENVFIVITSRDRRYSGVILSAAKDLSYSRAVCRICEVLALVGMIWRRTSQ
jgi:hypothetical protein